MKSIMLACLCCLSTSVFAAELVAKRGDGNPYAPVNEAKGGTVKYNSTGFGSNGRRQDAYKKMFDHCGGPYKVIKEEMQREGTGAIVVAPAINTITQNWTYFDFECVNK